MKSIRLRDIAEIVGLVAVVASLVFLGIQVRQTQDTAVAEAYSTLYSTRFSVANSIKEHIDLWRRGAAGEELDEDEMAIFALLVNQLNESFAGTFSYRTQVAGVDAAQYSARDFAGFLYQNPGARAVWNRREDNLARIRGALVKDAEAIPIWTETVRGYLAELDRVRPQFDENVFVDF